jgi:hypothetical protein
LAIDIVEPAVFWSRIPVQLRSRLQYHQAEATDWLDKEILEAYLSMYFPEVVYSNVTVIHFSPECQTPSEAGNTGARDKYSPDWTHPHRVLNGTTFAPTSDKGWEAIGMTFRTERLPPSASAVTLTPEPLGRQ